MWLLEKGGSGMNYQEALRNLENYVVEKLREEDLSINHFTIEFEVLKQLIDEKLEQESRKDKLILGSQWECVCKTYGKVKIIDIHPLSKTVTFRNMLFSQTEKIDDFIICFRPLKEGE